MESSSSYHLICLDELGGFIAEKFVDGWQQILQSSPLISAIYSVLSTSLCAKEGSVPLSFEYSKTSGVFFSLLLNGPLPVLHPEPGMEELASAPALMPAAGRASSSRVVSGSLPIFFVLISVLRFLVVLCVCPSLDHDYSKFRHFAAKIMDMQLFEDWGKSYLASSPWASSTVCIIP